ncbi:MAG: RDD family protein [SAR324 cluster bacterium]|nr:RDD family protein [SAR324 cluster bacterium]
MTPPKEHSFYPSIPRRVVAALMDQMLVILGAAVFLSLFKTFDSIPFFWRHVSVLSLLFFYEPALVCCRGQTLGHQVMKMRVLDLRTRASLGLIRSFLRFIIKTLLGWFSLAMLFLQVEVRPYTT